MGIDQRSPCKTSRPSARPVSDDSALFDTLFSHMEEARGVFLSAAQASGGRSWELPAGEFIFHQGETPVDALVLDRGTAKVGRLAETGEDLTLGVVGPGDFVGLSETLIHMPYVRYARAITDVRMWRVGAAEMERLLREHAAFRRAMLVFPALRFLDAQVRATGLYTGPIRARLAQLLVRLAHESGRVADSAGAPGMRLTQEEMASAIGTTRQSVSSLLVELRHAGLVQMRHGRVEIPDVDALMLWAAIPARQVGT